MSAAGAVLEEGSPKVRVGRQVRAGIVRSLQKALEGAEAVVVARVEKIPARELNQLRRSLGPLRSDFMVVKNRLGRATFRGIGWSGLEKAFEGTCGISPVRGDVTAVCKLLAAFSKEHEGFVFRGGILKGQVLEAKELAALARMPGRQVLLAQLVGMAQSPLRRLAVLAQGPIRSLALLLSAVGQKKGK